jgi:hypothetical protein
VGKEERTELTNTSLSSYDKNDAVEYNLLSILSIKGERSMIVGFVVPISNPK